MGSRKKSFREKLVEDKGLPRVETISSKMAEKWGAGTIVLPSAPEVDGLMRRVRKGRVTTINALRETLAARHGATIACPIVTGILARVAAGAAGEDEAEGHTVERRGERYFVRDFERKLADLGE